VRLPIIKRYTAVGKVATDGNILVPVNNLQIAFAVAVGILFSSDAGAAAAAVQFTYDAMDQDWYQPVTISQAATVISVTDPNLPAKGGLSGTAGLDVVRIQGTGIVGIDGEWPVATVPTPTTYTLTSSVNQAVAATQNGKAALYRMFTSLITATAGARGFGNLSAGIAASAANSLNSGPVTAIALNVTALPAGSAYLQLLQAMGR
jgi:hypothetical protein